MDNKYTDIINIERPISKHPKMSIEERSAQFAPFAALTGYKEATLETERFVEDEKILEEEQKSLLSDRINYIINNIEKKPLITFTYFVKDARKDGGKYITITKKVIRIDEYNKEIILEGKEKINIKNIISISGDIFKNL